MPRNVMKPTKAKKRNLPKLRLADLLRRRKMTLKQLLDEFGITTYGALLIRCDRMGVMPPEQSEFDSAVGTTVVSSPTEGVVVLEAPPVIDDTTGKVIDVPEQTNELLDAIAEFDPAGRRSFAEEQPAQKKKRKRESRETDE